MKNFTSLLLLVSIFGLSNAQQRGLPQAGASGVRYSGRMVSTSRLSRTGTMVVDQYFQQSLEVIASQRFEENRLQVASQMVDRNYVTSDQIRQIITLFWFEGTRLDFSKYAYARVADPANYFMVAQAFQFPSSVEELERFVGYDLHGNHVCNSTCHHNNGMQTGSSCENTFSMAVMHPQDFSSLVRTMNASSFDSSKLAIARQAIRSNYVSAEQIRQLMFLLTFESSRLELAKFAYKQVVDKENYFIVNDAFTFSSSIDELDHYLYH